MATHRHIARRRRDGAGHSGRWQATLVMGCSLGRPCMARCLRDAATQSWPGHQLVANASRTNVIELPPRRRIKRIPEPAPRPPKEAITRRAFSVIPARAVYDPDVQHGTLRMLAAICHHTNKSGITWVSQDKLAAMLGLKRSAVSTQFAKLRKTGYLKTIHKAIQGKRPNTIKVLFNPSQLDQTNTMPRPKTKPPTQSKATPQTTEPQSNAESHTLRTKEEREEAKRKLKESYFAEGLTPPDERIEAEVDEMLRRLAGS